MRRPPLALVVALLPAPRLAAQSPAAPPATTAAESRAPASAPHAVVDARHGGADGAPVRGVPTYRTIGAALAAVPGENRARHVIFVRDGRYREKLTVAKPLVTLLGQSRDGTVLTYDAAAGTRDSAGVPYGTRGSFTLRVAAPDFRAERLTVENAFDFPANAAKADGDPTKLRDTQGVAVMTYEGSDRAAFVSVRLLGHQDTFFPNVGRHYLKDCEIAGHVDFIFGAGQAVFEDCDIVSRDRGDPANNGYVVAPSTEITQPYGFLFVRSRLRKASPAMARGSVALGRPWHPSARPTAVGSAVFVDCWMDDHISAKGWDRMSSVDSTSGVRYWFEPEAARFFERGSTGPGALAGPTRRTLGDGDARTYTITRVLGGWMPEPSAVTPPR